MLFDPSARLGGDDRRMLAGHPNRIKEVVDRELTEDEQTRSVTMDDKVFVCSDQV